MKVHLAQAIAVLATTLSACGGSGTGSATWPDGGQDTTTTADGALGGGNPGVDGSTESGAVVIGVDGSMATGGPDGSVTTGGPDASPGKATAGKLVLDIAGTTQGTDYAFLKVAGKSMLGGELQLNFATGFVPKSGQKFTVVTAAGGVTGAFAKITTNGIAVTPGQDATTFYVTVN